MGNLIKKLIISIKTDGILGLFKKTIRFFFQQSGFIGSETYFFQRMLNGCVGYNKRLVHESLTNYSFSVLQTRDDLINLKKMDRFEIVPFDKWLRRGSKCLAILLNDQMIAYTWIHSQYYDNLGHAGEISLDENERFIGPFYTDPLQRRKGLYYLLMDCSLHYLKESGVNVVYGTSSSENIATIKVVIHSGFNIFGIVRYKKGKGRQVIELNHEDLLATKISF